MTLTRTPMRQCGKQYPTAEEAREAAARKQAADGSARYVTLCLCEAFHIRLSPDFKSAPEKGTGPRRDAAGRNSGPAPAVRRLVLERDGYACVCCGLSVIGQRYSLGHRLRASQGGKAVPSNLVTLLGWGGEACHGRIDLYRDPEDEAKGYRLPSGTDPAAVPVMVFSGHGSGFTAWPDDHGNWLSGAPGGAA